MGVGNFSMYINVKIDKFAITMVNNSFSGGTSMTTISDDTVVSGHFTHLYSFDAFEWLLL